MLSEALATRSAAALKLLRSDTAQSAASTETVAQVPIAKTGAL